MKFKLISLFFLAISLQSLAMEQGNKNWQKKRKKDTAKIDRKLSLGDLSILPDELLIKIIMSIVQNSDPNKTLWQLKLLEKTSKQLRSLVYDSSVENAFTSLKKQYEELTNNLISKLNAYAIDSELFNKITELISQGADVNAKSKNGRTALMFAARYGFETTVRILLAHHADVNIKDNNGVTALSDATVNRHNAIATLLKEHGAQSTQSTQKNNCVIS